MSKQIQDAYIVSAIRTPVGKAPRGVFRNTRPDDMLAFAIDAALSKVPQVDKSRIDDAVIGCAMPEAEQGMNVARIAVLLAGLPNVVSAVTVNRFCSSGLQAVAMAADRIRLGEADLMIGGGTESMSMVPMMGYHPRDEPARSSSSEHIGIAYGMAGITVPRTSPSNGRSDAKNRTRSPRGKLTAAALASQERRRVQRREISAPRARRPLPGLSPPAVSPTDSRAASRPTKARAPAPRWKGAEYN